MNETITLSRLISRIASATGTDANTSRRFLRELLNTVRERLQAGESVSIDGFGTFAISADGKDVRFVPDAALAEEINRPFAMFKPVTLAKDLTPEELDSVDQDLHTEISDTEAAEEQVLKNEPEMEEPEVIPSPEPEATAVDEQETVPEPEELTVEAEENPDNKELKEEEAKSDHSQRPVPSFPEDEEPPLHVRPQERTKQKGRAWLWFAGAATIIGCAGGYFAGTLIDINDHEDTTQQVSEQPAASVVEEITEPTDSLTQPEEENRTPAEQTAAPQQETSSQTERTSSEPVYDVVDGNNYLSVIANRHYGVRNYWVFIYEANRDVIQNPNVIAPGTRVVIPPRESLPGSTEEERRQIASRKIGELSRR